MIHKKTLKQLYPQMITNNIMTDLLQYDVPWIELISDGFLSASALDAGYYSHSANKTASPLVLDVSNQTYYDAVTPLTTSQREQLASIVFALYGKNWISVYNAYMAEYNPLSNYDMTETETISEESDTESRHTGTYTDTGTNGETATVERDGSSNNDVNTDTTISTTDTGTITTAKTESQDRGVYGFNSSTSQSSDETNVIGSETQTNNLAHSETNNVNTDNDTTYSDTEETTRTLNNSNTHTNNLTDTNDVDKSIDRTLTRSGNIGVTTSQQMLESELELRKWNFFERVYNDIDSVCCLSIY